MGKTLSIEEQLEAAKNDLAASNERADKAETALQKLQAEFDEFKLQSEKLIKDAQAGKIVVISDKVVEFEGKKYEFTQTKFGMIGEKGRINRKAIRTRRRSKS